MNPRSSVARALAWLGLGLPVLLLLPAVGLLLFDRNTAKPHLAAWISSKSGRHFTVGDIGLDLALKPGISLRNLKLENAEWGLSQPMVTAESLPSQVDLAGRLHSEVIFPRVSIGGAWVLLQRNAEGKSNRDFVPGPLAAPAVEPLLPEERPEIPAISLFRVTDTEIDYRSPPSRQTCGWIKCRAG